MRVGLSDADSRTNRLLAALPEKDRRTIAKHLEAVALAPGQNLLDSGQGEFVYFPLSGAAAKFVEMANGHAIGAGIVGNEGVVPLWRFFSRSDETPFRVEMQNSGEALRMTCADFYALAKPGRPLHDLLLRFAAAFAGQVALGAACNRLHQVQEQYCRWLLMTRDRIGADEFELTQDAAARILGVRRMSVTAAARQLRKKGVVDYCRGRLVILDRPALERASCECYRRMTDIYQAILPGPGPNDRATKPVAAQRRTRRRRSK
jgi:hypothetical protein